MVEFWDIYDEQRNKTGKLAERGVDKLKEGEYHIIVVALILNSKNEILITKRASTKKVEPLKWELTGGSIVAGETSLEGMLREVREEIGLNFTSEEATFFTSIRRDQITQYFKDVWLFKKDVKIEDITFADGEAIDAKWVTIEEFLQMKEKNETVLTIDFGRKEYELALTKIYT